MKKTFTYAAALLLVASMSSSCYVYTGNVGKGAQSNQSVSGWNHYVLFGLAPVGTTDPNKLSGGAENYTITNQMTFVNGLVAVLTFGLYTPTTTTVTK
jgi:hypothetical protein